MPFRPTAFGALAEPDDLYYKLRGMSGAALAGRTPARVLLIAARSRIAALARLNAFISVSAEVGDGPIVAVKDLIDVQGLVTTAGGRRLPDTPAQTDAAVISRLRAYGCVMIGKTNLHEFAYGSTSENPHYGPVRNPHDEKRIAGGSSGGSAVAVATAMCDWAIGTDTAGSLRIPASLCGVASMKPSPGLIPTEGSIPLSRSLDVIGPMAMSVTTLAQAMAMMTNDGRFASLKPADGPLRLCVAASAWVGALDEETAVAWGGVSRGLPEIELPDRAAMSQVCATVSMYEASAYHRDWITTHPERYGDADVRDRLIKGLSIPSSDHAAALAKRPALLAAVEQAMRGFDAILVPATAIVAPLIGGPDVREPMTRFTRPFSATGQPVLTLPAKVSGLPVGIQVVGRAGGDRQLLEVGLALEALWR
jgi:aspartyl-tRNA(Asn)/glutamyl-tRNA(Gln) amidotransferase subunit A